LNCLKEIHGHWESGVLRVDVRSATEFRAGHVPGACNIPLEELESRLDDLDCGRRIMLICKSGQRSEVAACRLKAHGIAADVETGGTDAWVKAGLALVVSSRTRWSLERQVRLGAGVLVLLAVVMALAVDQKWLYLAGFVGLGLTVAGITDFCPMARILSAMPWNGIAPQRNTPGLNVDVAAKKE
jgi:rhodanese-related sulfurtransferase